MANFLVLLTVLTYFQISYLNVTLNFAHFLNVCKLFPIFSVNSLLSIAMSCSTLTREDLTLAILPPDIIRMIIRRNTGECMKDSRMISRICNTLIVEFLKRLPPIESVVMKLDSQYKEFSLDCTIATEHLQHFEYIFPKEWTTREEVTEFDYLPITLGPARIRLVYRRQLDYPSTFIFLSRLFQSTNQIDFLSFGGFDEKSLTIVRETMRNVNIQYLEIRKTKLDRDIRKITREIIRLHQVYHLIVVNYTFYTDELCEIFEIIPKSTPNVTVAVADHNGMTPQEFQEYCDSLGEFLVDKKGKALAKFVSAPTLVCEKGEPFLMFMRIFLEYDLF